MFVGRAIVFLQTLLAFDHKANSWTLVTYFLKNLKGGLLGANQH